MDVPHSADVLVAAAVEAAIEQPKKPFLVRGGAARRAQYGGAKRGVSVSATNTESSIAATMVSENSR